MEAQSQPGRSVRGTRGQLPPAKGTGRLREMFEQHLGRSVTIDQAAALLSVSRRTVYNRIRDGKLQTIRTIGGSQRVVLSSLDGTNRPVWSGVSVEPSSSTPQET